MTKERSYVTPLSEGSTGSCSPTAAPSGQTMMSTRESPASVDVTRPRLAIKRDRDPPKNSAGELYCDHADCRSQARTFRRPCEWNKHMDKHDRPYKCQDPDCDKLAGFTYSGGLLRHQREVHKMHAPSKGLMCPFPTCNRSSGKGFTRQENRKEHIRRLHRGNDGKALDIPSTGNDVHESDTTGFLSPTESQSLKRRRRSDDDSGHDSSGDDVQTLREEIRRLRRENDEKSSQLDALEKTVKKLQQNIHTT